MRQVTRCWPWTWVQILKWGILLLSRRRRKDFWKMVWQILNLLLNMPLPVRVVEIRKLEKSVFTGPVVSSCWDVISWTVPINRPDHPVSGVIIALPRCGRQVSDGTLTKRVLWVTWVGWICYGCVLAWDQRLTWRSHPIRQWRLIITRQIWFITRESGRYRSRWETRIWTGRSRWNITGGWVPRCLMNG